MFSKRKNGICYINVHSDYLKIYESVFTLEGRNTVSVITAYLSGFQISFCNDSQKATDRKRFFRRPSKSGNKTSNQQ